MSEALRSDNDGGLQPVVEQLKVHLPQILDAVSRQINLDHLAVKSGSVGNVTVGQVAIGEVNVGSLKLLDTSATLHSSQALLEDVGMNLELQFKLKWWYNLGFFGSGSGTQGIPSLFFAMTIGDVMVPSLDNIQLNLPVVSVDGITASIPPMSNLDLGGASFAQVDLTNTQLPAAGFGLTGMSLGTLSLSEFAVPETKSEAAKIGQFRTDQAVTLPSLTLGPVSIPSTSVPSAQSGSFNMDAVTETRSFDTNLGIFGIELFVTPIAHMNVGAMTLSGMNLSATLGSIAVEDIQIPVEMRDILLKNLTLAGLTATDLAI